MNETSVVPINIVNNNDHLVKSRSIHSTSRRNVVKSRRIITATLAIPQLRAHNESSKTKKVWKVLFDSGSDGDIAFIRKSEKASIDMHKRLHPQQWKTSNGIFETNKVGNIQLT